MASQWVIAIATIVLVAVTAFYAQRTSRMAEATKEIADATRASVDVANAALVLQHVPIVVPRPAGGGGSTAPDGVWDVGVGLENIGGANAFNVDVEVSIGEHSFRQGPFDTMSPEDERKKVSCSLRYADFAAAGQKFSAKVGYTDVLSREYVVTRSPSGAIALTLDGKPLRLAGA